MIFSRCLLKQNLISNITLPERWRIVSEMSGMAEIAEQLGINGKDARGLVVLNRVLANRIVVIILAFFVGLISGMFFPGVRSVYPYSSGGMTSAIGISRFSKKSFLLNLLLGILSFIVGFALSSQVIFATVYHRGQYTLYGVFARRDD